MAKVIRVFFETCFQSGHHFHGVRPASHLFLDGHEFLGSLHLHDAVNADGGHQDHQP